jgi:alkanesulfonate monooxygenase SsuD/methylene tetrahydromethanopterin reductase-like flavin-dependent oxidoreductase (luciferase family)
MEIGIGLPNAVAGTEGDQLVEWARRADDRGFSSLGTIDRLVYDNYDPLIALAASAAVTERIRLLTSILIPHYRNTAVVAKQAASLQALSGGRLVLGLGLGGRDDDHTAAGSPTTGRADKLAEQFEELKRIWAGEERGDAGAIGPPIDQPELIVGVGSGFERFASLADGWMAAGAGPDQFAVGAEAADKAWEQAGKGKPRKLALAYFALGDTPEEDAKRDLEHYYAWLGDEIAQMISGSAAKGPEMVAQYVAGFEQAGCDELVLFPSSSDPEQVNLLADAVGK